VREHGVTHRAWIADALVDELGHVPLEAGLRRAPEPFPNMVLHPVPEPPAPAEGVSVRAVDGTGLLALVDVSTDLGMPRELAERVFTPALVDDPDVRVFIASLAGHPVGTSLAIRTGDASGVYSVGTVRAARRRGVGSAATWAAVDAGREWGCDVVVLQSTPMAVSMYEDMGFRTVATYAMFLPSV
jgi:ribosomal protein S18 acetylase RimI-like enzyme